MPGPEPGILIAIQLKERDLTRFIGSEYERYREQVPLLVPLPGRRYEG